MTPSGFFLLVLRLFVSGVLVVAGVAKLGRRTSFQETLRQFGVSSPLASLLVWVLPFVELATAALLLANPTTQLGAAAAAVLLAVFTTAIAYQLARGRSPECTCFGAIQSRPVSNRTLVRNVVLLAGTAPLIVVDPAIANMAANAMVFAVTSMVSPWALSGVLMLVTVGQSLTLLHVMRRYGLALGRLDTLELERSNALASVDGTSHVGLPIGADAPFPDLLPDAPAIVIFLHPDCAACAELSPHIERWQRVHGDAVRIVRVDNAAVSNAYGVPGTPAAVMVDGDKRIASSVAVASQAVRALVARVSHPRVGVRVPNVRLTAADGTSISLRDAITRDTVLLFWNPECPFCQQLIPALVDWAGRRDPSGPNLLIVSSAAVTGDQEKLLAQVYVDQDSVALEFRAMASPSALAIDREGTLRSQLLMGSDHVLELIGARQPAAAAR